MAQDVAHRGSQARVEAEQRGQQVGRQRLALHRRRQRVVAFEDLAEDQLARRACRDLGLLDLRRLLDLRLLLHLADHLEDLFRLNRRVARHVGGCRDLCRRGRRCHCRRRCRCRRSHRDVTAPRGEGRSAAQEHVVDRAEGPRIDGERVTALLPYDLRCHVVDGAADRVPSLLHARQPGRQPKVGDLEVPPLLSFLGISAPLEQQVLRLDVAVDDTMRLVQVQQAAGRLNDEARGLREGQRPLAPKQLKGARVAQLEQQMHVTVVIEGVEARNDVPMVQPEMEVDLGLQLGLVDGPLQKDLGGDWRARLALERSQQVRPAERAAAQQRAAAERRLCAQLAVGAGQPTADDAIWSVPERLARVVLCLRARGAPFWTRVERRGAHGGLHI